MNERLNTCTDCGRTGPDVSGWPQRCEECLVAGDAWVFGLPAARSSSSNPREPDAGVAVRSAGVGTPTSTCFASFGSQ